MKISEAISAIEKKLQNKNNWTKNAFARDASGIPTTSKESSACSWCLLGAANSVCNQELLFPVSSLLVESIRELFPFAPGFIEDFNDDEYTKHSHIIQVIKHSRKKAELQEGTNNAI